MGKPRCIFLCTKRLLESGLKTSAMNWNFQNIQLAQTQRIIKKTPSFRKCELHIICNIMFL